MDQPKDHWCVVWCGLAAGRGGAGRGAAGWEGREVLEDSKNLSQELTPDTTGLPTHYKNFSPGLNCGCESGIGARGVFYPHRTGEHSRETKTESNLKKEPVEIIPSKLHCCFRLVVK